MEVHTRTEPMRYEDTEGSGHCYVYVWRCLCIVCVCYMCVYVCACVQSELHDANPNVNKIPQKKS